MLLIVMGASCGRQSTIIINVAQVTDMIPMGTEYLPRLNSAAWNEFLLTVTRSRIGIK